MRKTKRLLLSILSLFLITSAVGQVTETFVASTGANYQNILNKVDWNWARMWVEDNAVTEAVPNPKVTHGICVFDVSDVESQDVSSAILKFSFEKITAGALPTTVEIYYKEPYTGYKGGDVNYPEGCTVLGTVEITAAPQECSLSNDGLKAFVKAQIDAGKDAVLFLRSATPDVKLSFLGTLGRPTLDVEMPTAVTYAPSTSIKMPGTAAKDYFFTANDTVIIEFSKAMDKASVEAKFMVEPAAYSSAFTWKSDSIAYVVCEGLTTMGDNIFTVRNGAMAVDGTASKTDVSNTFYTVSDNVIKSESNFWNLSGANKTNALSVANTDSADVINDRKTFIYLDLSGTTSETDFKGIMLKCFDHQDANGWVKGPIGAENTNYVLYDVEFATFGAAFDGVTFDGMTKTKIEDIVIDSIYTVYNYNSTAVLDYLSSKAGEQVCIAIVDETPTVSASKPTIWLSDPSNNPNHGAPVVLYSDPFNPLDEVNDTVVYRVSDAAFENVAKHTVFNRDVEINGDMDILVHEYISYEFTPDYYTDTLKYEFVDSITFLDTTFVQIFDSIVVFDTAFVQVFDSISIYDTVMVTDTLLIDLEFSNSLNELVAFEVKAYPNPTKDYLTIDVKDFIDESLRVRIVNLSGVEIIVKDIATETTDLDLSGIEEKGLYLLQILNKDNIVLTTKKLLIE